MINQFYKKISTSLIQFADNRSVQIVLFVAFFLILQMEYINFINIPLFREKMGFDFEYSVSRLVFSNLMFVLLLLIIRRLSAFDYFINSMFFIFLSIPSLVFYEFMPNTPIAISLFVILFHILYYALSKLEFSYQPKIIDISERMKMFVLLIIVILMIIPFVINYGFTINTDAFDSSKIYSVRELGTQKLTLITGYFYGWIVRILIPIGFVIAIKQRKFIFAFLFLLMQVYLYSLLAQKLVFVTLFIMFIMVVRSYYQQITWILLSLILLIIMSKFVSIFTSNIMLESIVVRRTFFIPTIITKDYLEFFNDNYIYWSNSVLKMFSGYPYDTSPNILIGSEYFDGVIKSANTGFLGDGYMNFGYFGMLLNTIGVVVVFRLFSMMKISSDYSGVFIIIIYTLVNGYFFTSLLTHGILVLLFVSFFILRNTHQEQ